MSPSQGRGAPILFQASTPSFRQATGELPALEYYGTNTNYTNRNVGFLRYWTPGNIPLFLLATPVIYLLMKSGMEMLKAPMASLSKNLVFSSLASRECFVRSVALSQLILAALAVTHYHVQVITRISSGYPLWCFWLASKLGDAKGSVTGRKFVIFMVMYATVQGALFASFLPPA